MATINLTLNDTDITDTAKAVLVGLLAKSARGQVLPVPGSDALAGKFDKALGEAIQKERTDIAAALRAIGEASTSTKLDLVADQLFSITVRPTVEFDTGAEDDNGDPIMDTRPMNDVEFKDYLSTKAQVEIPKTYTQLVGTINNALDGLLVAGTPVAEVLATVVQEISAGG